MADDKGRAIDEITPSRATCAACGKYHQGSGAGLWCLQEEIRRLRNVIVAAKIPGAFR